jgi:carboxyl-terminal processing protease
MDAAATSEAGDALAATIETDYTKDAIDYVYHEADTTDKKLIESAINGMLTSLDPHSSYLDVDSFNYMNEQTKGKFGGLGIEITMDNGLVKVVSPIDDTPADKAGIKAGDYITHIDDEQVFDLTLNQAVKKMKGRPGTKVKLTVVSEDGEPKTLTLKRDIIKVKSVKFEEKVLAGADAEDKETPKIGYIRISDFGATTARDLKDALS